MQIDFPDRCVYSVHVENATVELLVEETDDHLSVWVTVDDGVQAAATVVPLPEAAGAQ